MDYISQGMSQHHPDHDLHGMVKGLEQQHDTAPGYAPETSEAGKVGAGDAPPDTSTAGPG
jgi:hypothetical protein